MVMVEDEENNFNLNYAFDVMIRDNQPDRNALGQPTQVFTQIGATTEAYCGNRYGGYDLKIRTWDNVSDPTYGETHIAVNDVNITFTCLKYTCELGQTDYEQGGALAVLETNFPYCANGILRGYKDGYQTAEQFITTTPNAEFDLYLSPVKNIYNYDVVKHSLNNVNSYSPLDSEETAFISIKFVENLTTVHSTIGTYPLNFEAPPIEFLAEADFPYEIEVYLMKDAELIGGYKGIWQPDWFELDEGSDIEFHVVMQPAGEDSSTFFLNLEEYSKQIPQPIIT
jgi:hypothetical protein